ncbi:hypothetical protein SEA_DEVERA_37 [Mycobacterium phage Devera]|nr:hypothetical protein SEA_DEVERA_37 [Mycobacterium phage Devera]
MTCTDQSKRRFSANTANAPRRSVGGGRFRVLLTCIQAGRIVGMATTERRDRSPK